MRKFKKVLITGGSSGIGKATAKMLTSKGAIVCITGRDKHKLDNVASELNASAVIRGSVMYRAAS